MRELATAALPLLGLAVAGLAGIGITAALAPALPGDAQAALAPLAGFALLAAASTLLPYGATTGVLAPIVLALGLAVTVAVRRRLPSLRDGRGSDRAGGRRARPRGDPCGGARELGGDEPLPQHGRVPLGLAGPRVPRRPRAGTGHRAPRPAHVRALPRPAVGGRAPVRARAARVGRRRRPGRDVRRARGPRLRIPAARDVRGRAGAPRVVAAARAPGRRRDRAERLAPLREPLLLAAAARRERARVRGRGAPPARARAGGVEAPPRPRRAARRRRARDLPARLRAVPRRAARARRGHGRS